MIDQEVETILLEGVLEEAEIRRGLRCTMPCVMNAARIAKFLLGQAAVSRSIAVIVLRQKAEVDATF